MSVEKNNNMIKLQIINEIIELYPSLKKDKEFIINKLIKKPVYNTLERVLYKGAKYYWDKKGNVYDVNVSLAGIYKIVKINNVDIMKFYYKHDIKELYTSLKNITKKHKINI